MCINIQTYILYEKYITKVKNLLELPSSRFELAEERTDKLEEPSQEERKKERKKLTDSQNKRAVSNLPTFV